MKKPRASPKTLGSMITTPFNVVSITFMSLRSSARGCRFRAPPVVDLPGGGGDRSIHCRRFASVRSFAGAGCAGPTMDPEGASPGELAIVLDRADIVPAQGPRIGVFVGPLEGGAFGARLGRVDVAEVLDHVDPGDRPDTVDHDLE